MSEPLNEIELPANFPAVSARAKELPALLDTETRAYSLSELLNGITEANVHAAIEFGAQVGKEIR